MKQKALLQLQQLLDIPSGVLRDSVRAFAKGGGQGGLPGFLAYLRQNGIITIEAYRRASSMASVSADGADDADEGGGSAASEAALRYEPYEVIAEGGMARIRVARDKVLRRSVAMKVLKPEVANESTYGRFVTEAHITAQLEHPSIVPVYSLHARGAQDTWFTMKLVEGKTLTELLKETIEATEAGRELGDELSLQTRIEHFLRVCDAMSYAHSRQVIHRDLKPSNIMVGPFREVYVMDWGIARVIGSGEEGDANALDLLHQSLTLPPGAQGSSLLGTPRFMSPEQVTQASSNLDARSDIFTLGVILYEIICLRPAFRGKGHVEVLMKVAKGQREPIGSRFPGQKIAPALAAIIDKATQTEREARYATVDELADDLRRVLRGEATSVLPDTTTQRMSRWASQHPGLIAGLGVGLLLVAAAAVLWGVLAQG